MNRNESRGHPSRKYTNTQSTNTKFLPPPFPTPPHSVVTPVLSSSVIVPLSTSNWADQPIPKGPTFRASRLAYEGLRFHRGIELTSPSGDEIKISPLDFFKDLNGKLSPVSFQRASLRRRRFICFFKEINILGVEIFSIVYCR